MSYIIKNNAIIAKTSEALKSGAVVEYAFHTCKEEINADREFNLVNAKTAKISNAKKWDAEYKKSDDQLTASEINPGEFLIR